MTTNNVAPWARRLTTEERVALGWPEEPAGADTIRTPTHARAATVGRWNRETRAFDEPSGFYPAGPVIIETEEGGFYDVRFYGLRGGPYATEEEAIEHGNRHALKTMAYVRKQRALHAHWDQPASSMAAMNHRGRIGDGWTLEDHHRPIVGEHVRLWAHGGYRTAIVVETTRGRGVTVAYATPSSPNDVHLTKTTKYAVSTGIRPVTMGA